MKKLRINLTTKFIILFLVISLIPLIIAIYVSYDSSKRVLEEETAYYFYGIIDNKVNQIESYFLEQKRSTTTLVKIPTIIEATEKFNDIFKKGGVNSSAYAAVDREIRPILTYFQESLGYQDLMLISTTGDLLFFVNDGERIPGANLFSESKDEDLKTLFNKSKNLLEIEMSSFKYDQTDKKLYASIITPIIKEESLIGFGLFKIDHQGVYNIIQDYTGLGETGEIILAQSQDNNAIFIAPLRHDFEAAFKRKIILNSGEEIDIQKALQGQKGWGITADYRGEKVLAVWRYLPLFQWGMVVKMDLPEVLELAADLRIRLLIISLILLLMIVLITILTVRSVSSPIRKLTSVAGEISKGDFLTRANINSGDEIEDLAESFNQMTDNLLKSQKNLEIKSDELADNLKVLNKEKQKVIQAKEKLDTVLYSIGEGVFVIDEEGKINIFNQEAENISGFSPQEIIGKKYDQKLKFITEERDRDKKEGDNFIVEFISLKKVGKFPHLAFLMTKNGKKIPISGNLAPLKSDFNKSLGYVVVFRDVTKEREIDKAKTEFVSLASHQLRTPLSAINWYSEMLLDEDVGKINKDQKKYLNSLYEASNRMVELVNALLNVSRIELGTFAIDPEPTNFMEVADSVIKEQNQQIEKKRLKLKKNYDLNLPIINADANLLRIVFQNLLSNAVKYTPEEGNVEITIKKEDKNVLIKVADSGYGIPKSQQQKIFTKLFRADNVLEKDTDGNGLGLYIVKSVVEQSGGRILFESEENKGTTFFVSIPLSGMEKKKGTKVLAN